MKQKVPIAFLRELVLESAAWVGSWALNLAFIELKVRKARRACGWRGSNTRCMLWGVEPLVQARL